MEMELSIITNLNQVYLIDFIAKTHLLYTYTAIKNKYI